jgi:hypothetical protein
MNRPNEGMMAMRNTRNEVRVYKPPLSIMTRVARRSLLGDLPPALTYELCILAVFLATFRIR